MGLSEADLEARLFHRQDGQMRDGLARPDWPAVHQELRQMNGKGGLIAVDRQGNICMPFNTGGMFRASYKAGGEDYIGMFYED